MSELVEPDGTVAIFRPSRIEKLRYFVSKNTLFVYGVAFLLVVVVCAVFAPQIATHDPRSINFLHKLKAPGLEHLMGTDTMGRDIFSRVIFGTRTSLMIGFSVLTIAIAIGVPIGLVAGYFGGRIDTILMRISDVFLAFPPLLLPLAITASLGAGLFNAMLALAVCWFPWYARIVRGAAMTVRQETYVTAARAMGAGHFRIMLRHELPNSLTPVIVQASMDFGYTILAAAALSFLGIGAKPPMVEWGLMVSMARSRFLDFWWTATFPGLAIFLTVLAANLVGDGIRDILDPKHKEF